jgi:hypothetical protein
MVHELGSVMPISESGCDRGHEGFPVEGGVELPVGGGVDVVVDGGAVVGEGAVPTGPEPEFVLQRTRLFLATACLARRTFTRALVQVPEPAALALAA